MEVPSDEMFFLSKEVVCLKPSNHEFEVLGEFGLFFLGSLGDLGYEYMKA